MCMECYADKSRSTPVRNARECLQKHTQYICGSCGRCVCMECEPKRGLQRWNFPFQSSDTAKLYLRTADYSKKKSCGIYEIKSGRGRLSYKIFADGGEAAVYLKKNAGKVCETARPVFIVEKYREYPHTQVRKLTDEEIEKYLSER